MTDTRVRVRRSTAAGVVLLIGVGAFLAGSRGQAPAQTAPADPPDACTLVTREEAEAALGGDVVVSAGRASCTYVAADPNHPTSLTVSPGPDELGQPGKDGSPPDFAGAMRDYARIGNAALQVATAGDEAWGTLSDGISQVIARTGDRFVTVILINVQTSEAERLATMDNLAGQALARMT